LLKNENKIFEIASPEAFSEHALEVFQFQYSHNQVYREWAGLLKTDPAKVTRPEQIPFMPVEFFKKFRVVCGATDNHTVQFTSSSTTSQTPSVHYVNKIELYKQSFLKCFERFYGSPAGYCFLALLPAYLQRSGSSLVYMCDELIRQSGDAHSGFYLDNYDALISTIHQLKRSGRKTILLGVSYALMDLADKNIALSDNFIVMETGGMKGRRRELVKQELHAYLKKGFGLQEIHSEYGMTELLSQAYSRKDGLFEAPPWMRFLTREVGDPLKLRNDSRTGGINVIDLANLYSCAFIATKDLGRLHPDGKLELMGRFDHSDVRGCNLMMENN
jgi:hypothetical protein